MYHKTRFDNGYSLSGDLYLKINPIYDFLNGLFQREYIPTKDILDMIRKGERKTLDYSISDGYSIRRTGMKVTKTFKNWDYYMDIKNGKLEFLNLIIQNLNLNKIERNIYSSSPLISYKGKISKSIDDLIIKTMNKCSTDLDDSTKCLESSTENSGGFTYPRCDEPIYTVNQYRDYLWD